MFIAGINKNSTQLLSAHDSSFKAPFPLLQYTIPFLLFSYWFFVSPFLFPHRMLLLSISVKIGLAGLFLISILQERRYPSLGILPWVIGFGFLSDATAGNAGAGLGSILGYLIGIFKGNIGSLLLMSLYMRSWERLANSLKVIVSLITATIALAGFYQMFSGELIADFSSLGSESIAFSIEKGRLCGLLYPSGVQSGVILLIPLGLLLVPLLSGRTYSKLILVLFVINLIALLLTFSRAAYLAFGLMYIAALIILSRHSMLKHGKTWIIAPVVLLIPFLIWAQVHLSTTGDLDRFQGAGTLVDRLTLYRLTIATSDDLFFGRGILTDLQEVNRNAFGIPMTPHNFFLTWVMRFAWIPSTVLLIILLKRLKDSFGLVFRSNLREEYFSVSLGVALVFLGVSVGSLFVNDAPYMVLFSYVLTNSCLKIVISRRIQFENAR